jgi:hypothetical protein
MTHPFNLTVITHKEIPWAIPVPHTIIGVEGFLPLNNGISAKDYISASLDLDTGFGALRAIPAMMNLIEKGDDSIIHFSSTYRLFMGSKLFSNWRVTQPDGIVDITPEKLTPSSIRTVLPPDFDILIPAPLALPCSILHQYHNSHILDDLLVGVSLAIRSGLVRSEIALNQLESNALIPFGMLITKKAIKLEFLDRLWFCIMGFYKEHYIPRTGYQRRVMDFVFERITSMAILELISKNNYSVASVEMLRISGDGIYKKTE